MNDQPARGPSMAEQERQRRQHLERTLEVIAVILLSLTTVLTAWSAYQATAWGSTMSVRFAEASTKRVLSTRASTAAGQLTTLDVDLFTDWLDAYAAGNTELEQFYQTRFRPEFQPAFQGWLQTLPRTNPEAPKSPFAMPEYQVSKAQEAATLDEEASALYQEALAANDERDNYAMTTVILASVLFFAGMAQRMKWFPIQVAMIALGVVVFLLAALRLVLLVLT